MNTAVASVPLSPLNHGPSQPRAPRTVWLQHDTGSGGSRGGGGREGEPRSETELSSTVTQPDAESDKARERAR